MPVPTSESEVAVCGKNVVPPPLLLLPHGDGKPPPPLPPRAISVTPVMRTEMGLWQGWCCGGEEKEGRGPWRV